MRERYTIETLASGQPRAYADTIHHVRVTFEHDYQGVLNRDGWEKTPISEQSVRETLPGLRCGFTEYVPDPHDYSMDAAFRTRLDWLKEIEPGVWEFHTTTRFTD